MRRRGAFGLLVWREHWTLSLKGRILVLILVLVAALVMVRQAYPFLAINRPLPAEVLIIEGWLPVHTIHQAAAEFTAGHYRRVFIVRALYEGEEGVVHGRTAGEYAALVLVRCGVPEDAIEIVYFQAGAKDRTYHSALAVRDWLAEKGRAADSFDVLTIGPHARRSRLLYRKAFGGTAAVGVIALNDPAYDAGHWWRTSEGVRDVLGETVAYLYARFH